MLRPGWMGIPFEIISGAGFTSYLWPAVVLIGVIGFAMVIVILVVLALLDVLPGAVRPRSA